MGLRDLFAKARLLAILDRLPHPANDAQRFAAVEAAKTALVNVTAADVSAATWADLHGDLPPKSVFLGTAGAVDAIGATTQIASSTAAVYYAVPTGKVAYVWCLKIAIFDNTATAMTPVMFAAQTAPTQGLRIRTTAADGSTTANMLTGGVVNNIALCALTGTPLNHMLGADFGTPHADHKGCAVTLTWKFAQPIVLTAGQRFEVKHLESVAYTFGACGIEVSEVTL